MATIGQSGSNPAPATGDRANGRLLGQAVERVEDDALLRGRGQFIDDAGVRPGTVYATFVRSPHAHARIVSIDPSAALALPGVRAVVTGQDASDWTRPFVVGVKQPMEHWCLAVDRVRYAGEPVAIVVAEDRYVAEDAAELLRVEYEPLAAVTDPRLAAADTAPVLHEAVGQNVVSDRAFSYGEGAAPFASAPHVFTVDVEYPRSACTPIECYGVIAEFEPDSGAYDVLANFQGPFTLHPVMALALRVPGNQLRLRTPRDSGNDRPAGP